MLEKVQRAHRTQQICLGAKHGREFYRDSVGACVPKTYQKLPKTGPKRTRGDITVTPENIFEIKIRILSRF
jgi:hypothetical protein